MQPEPCLHNDPRLRVQALTLHVDGQVLIALYVELEALLAETSRARLALFMYPQVSWGVSNGLGMRARLQRGMLLHADAQACFPVQLKELPCAALVPSMTGEGGIPPPRPFPSPGPRILRGSDCDQS